MSTRRQRRSDGALFAVPLGGDLYGAGRLLSEPLAEFLDLWVSDPSDIDAATAMDSNVLFRVWVMNSAITSGRWPIVARRPLSPEEATAIHRFFKKDALSGQFSIYWSDPASGLTHEEPATSDQVAGLERAAVWSAEHIEDRLRDARDGVPNRWLRSMLP